ncbi:MAG TPA: pilin [Candidatus Paceibacterota bacterium]|nr:pilin [Candidatus Paceibacterota bacterium]
MTANLLKIAIAAMALFVSTKSAMAQLSYELLRPLPNFPRVIGTDLTLTQYLQNVFYLILGLSATAAVILFVLYGFAYMTSDIVVKKEEAKKHLTQVVWGIGLLLTAYLILYTINPRLVNLDAGLSKLRTEVAYVPRVDNSRVGAGSTADMGTRGLTPAESSLERELCERAKARLGTAECRITPFDPALYEQNCAAAQGGCNPSDVEEINFKNSCERGGGIHRREQGTSTSYCICRSNDACPGS